MKIKSKYSNHTIYWMGAFALFILCSFTVGDFVINELTQSKKTKYRKDATRLALRLLTNNSNYLNAKAEVPNDVVESIYQALVSIHMSDSEPARSVTQIHKLHTFPIPTVDNFLVVYRRDANWAKPLRLGDTRTDSDQINDLIDQYGLKIDNNVEWDEDHYSFNVRATESLNLAPIANDFKNIDGIKQVDLLTPNGDGNDIEVREVNDGWEVNYIIKFDSCFTGCKKQHIWKFFVNESGEVAFLEECGDTLPVWMARKGK